MTLKRAGGYNYQLNNERAISDRSEGKKFRDGWGGKDPGEEYKKKKYSWCF